MNEDIVEKAIRFATKSHEGQVRKGSQKPYIIHPLEVGNIVSTVTKDKEIIAAAILHDTIEDCEGITKEVIRESFGSRVAELVASESEDKTKTWYERKSATIERLKTAPFDVQVIALADKLSNIRTLDEDYIKEGEEVWNRFRVKDKETIGWYCKGVRDSLIGLSELEIYQEYCKIVKKIFE